MKGKFGILIVVATAAVAALSVASLRKHSSGDKPVNDTSDGVETRGGRSAKTPVGGVDTKGGRTAPEPEGGVETRGG